MPQPYFVQYRLDNKLIDNPVERFETSIQVQFDQGGQGSIETSQLTFVNDAYKIIRDSIKSGLSGGIGITEGLPLTINIQEGSESLEIFKGYLDYTTLEDLTGDEKHVNEPKFLASIVKEDGLNNLSERLEGLSFALLESQKVITPADYIKVKYIVEKQVTFLEQAFLALSIYLMIKELAEAATRLAQQVAIIASIVTTPISGQIGALIYAIASAIFEAVYIAIMGAALAELIIQIRENLLPSVKEFNGINYRNALNKIFSYLGYDLQVSSGQMEKDLNSFVYLPSKAEGRQDKGIPFDSDFGFVANEFVSMVLEMFRAEIFIEDNVSGKSIVNIRTKKDPFFQNKRTYVLPSVLSKSFSYNINEIKESRIYSFLSDVTDVYTVSNWEGTSIVITTLPVTSKNPKNNLLKGLENRNFPVALGNKKTELSALEETLSAFFKVADFVLSLFNKDVTDVIQNRVNILKISQQFFSVPKILKIKNEKLSFDSRTGLSAPYLWDNYLNYDSYILDNFKRQRKTFNDIDIPFSYKDYKKVIKNSYFVTDEGRRGKFTSLEWSIESDTAKVSFWIEEIYTKNLKEEITIVK